MTKIDKFSGIQIDKIWPVITKVRRNVGTEVYWGGVERKSVCARKTYQ